MRLEAHDTFTIPHREMKVPELTKSLVLWSMKNPPSMDKRSATVSVVFWVAQNVGNLTSIEVLSFDTPPAMNSKMLNMLKSEYRSILRSKGYETRFMFFNIKWEGNEAWAMSFDIPDEEFICL